MATPIISTLRGYVPNFLVLFMTRATMAFEAGIPVLLLQPLARRWARRGVVFMMCTLHLAFGTTFVLGPFAWSACVFATLLFSRDDWELAVATEADYRGRGYARDVVSAASRFTLDQNRLPIYIHDRDNGSSAFVARAVGFQLYAEIVLSEY